MLLSFNLPRPRNLLDTIESNEAGEAILGCKLLFKHVEAVPAEWYNGACSPM